jgi:carboxypeptidase family protein
MAFAATLRLLTITLLAFIPKPFGQTVDGNLVGMITDPMGATVPNAKVEITNTQTGVKTAVRTDVDGLYRFNNVPVGAYDIGVTAAGFALSTLKAVAIELNKTATANVIVKVPTVREAIAVLEAPNSIDTTTSQLQSTFKADQIVDLPIIESAGNFFGPLNLSLMSAGVASNGAVGQGTGPSVGGQRPTNSNFSIEGVDNNNKNHYRPSRRTTEGSKSVPLPWSLPFFPRLFKKCTRVYRSTSS